MGEHLRQVELDQLAYLEVLEVQLGKPLQSIKKT